MIIASPAEFDMSSYYNEKMLHALGLASVLLLGGQLVMVPRRYGLLPIILMACFAAPSQRIVLFGLDFTLLRLLIVFGCLRIVITREYSSMQWKRIDTLFCAWLICSVLCYALLRGTSDALVNRLGYL